MRSATLKAKTEGGPVARHDVSNPTPALGVRDDLLAFPFVTCAKVKSAIRTFFGVAYLHAGTRFVENAMTRCLCQQRWQRLDIDGVARRIHDVLQRDSRAMWCAEHYWKCNDFKEGR